MYLVKLTCAAEGRWLAGPDSPLADPERRPLSGFAVHEGNGVVRLDADAVQALRALPPGADGHVSYETGAPVLHFGRDSYPVVDESQPAHS